MSLSRRVGRRLLAVERQVVTHSDHKYRIEKTMHHPLFRLSHGHCLRSKCNAIAAVNSINPIRSVVVVA